MNDVILFILSVFGAVALFGFVIMRALFGAAPDARLRMKARSSGEAGSARIVRFVQAEKLLREASVRGDRPASVRHPARSSSRRTSRVEGCGRGAVSSRASTAGSLADALRPPKESASVRRDARSATASS